jgi:DNA sulfur modification protein DndD
MRIEQIKLRNYRQFSNEIINFPKKVGSDLHIFIGENGTGKTNILNAINWCLYGDEPHLSRDSQTLPIINLNSIDNQSKNGDLIETSIELTTDTGNNSFLKFCRKTVFRIYDEESIFPQEKIFQVQRTGKEGNVHLIDEENSVAYVDKFVPQKIREFFFFDGERLDKYFREENVNIRNAVFRISQLDLLEAEIERKLQIIISDLEKEAGKLNPDIEKIRKEYTIAKEKYEELTKLYETKQIQSSKAKKEIEELSEKLQGVPNVDELEYERSELNDEKDLKSTLLSQKVEEKNKLLFEIGIITMLFPIIQKTLHIVHKKTQNGELPPPINQNLLKSILNEEFCNVCGRKLDNVSIDYIHETLDKIKLSSEAIFILSHIEGPLSNLRNRIKNVQNQLRSMTLEINSFNADIDNIDTRLAEINRKVAFYDEKQVSEWYNQREHLETEFEQLQREIGGLIEQIKNAEVLVNDNKEHLEKSLEKEKKAQKISKERDFCEEALKIVKKTKYDIMREIREKIELQTQEFFFDLTWKHKTFKSVEIDSDYNIRLFHKMGYECLGSISAAERALLALSFTLALHEVSGFDSPILIDTPVARISGKHRENFGNTLSMISENKQTILLFTPDEYTSEVSKYLDKQANSRRIIKMSSDERKSELEDL